MSEYALSSTKENRHYRCALGGALQHQANTFLTASLNASHTTSDFGALVQMRDVSLASSPGSETNLLYERH